MIPDFSVSLIQNEDCLLAYYDYISLLRDLIVMIVDMRCLLSNVTDPQRFNLRLRLPSASSIDHLLSLLLSDVIIGASLQTVIAVAFDFKVRIADYQTVDR